MYMLTLLVGFSTAALATSALDAQATVPVAESSLAGCFALTLGVWQNPYAGGQARWQIIPAVIRLDTVPVAGSGPPSWYKVSPNPAYFMGDAPNRSPAWRVIAPDTVRAFWSDGFTGTTLLLSVRGDTLSGRASAFTDRRILGGGPSPSASATAVRVACPDSLQPG